MEIIGDLVIYMHQTRPKYMYRPQAFPSHGIKIFIHPFLQCISNIETYLFHLLIAGCLVQHHLLPDWHLSIAARQQIMGGGWGGESCRGYVSPRQQIGLYWLVLQVALGRSRNWFVWFRGIRNWTKLKFNFEKFLKMVLPKHFRISQNFVVN